MLMLPRRAALGGVALLAGGAASAPDWKALAQLWLKPLRAAVANLPGPGLIRSYTVRTGAETSDFDLVHGNCAYVYDNAVAALALLASGDEAGASRIAAALAQAQSSDRFWHDGRLRNAYAAGPMTAPAKLPGWWDDRRGTWLEDGYHAGTATGVMAWAMLLWSALGREFRDAAERAADWIVRTQSDPRGFTGGFIGHEPAPQRLMWVSTEHNLDCAVVFSRIGRAVAAGHAWRFVDSMWDGAEGRRLTGLTPAGLPNRHSAVDANLWPMLAGRVDAAALRWVLSRHGMPAGAPWAEIDGVDFDTDRDSIWLEGTAIAALACRVEGANANRLAATLLANTTSSGLIYATTTEQLTTGLSTGLDQTAPDFLYFRRPHLAATAWAALAALHRSPFDAPPS